MSSWNQTGYMMYELFLKSNWSLLQLKKNSGSLEECLRVFKKKNIYIYIYMCVCVYNQKSILDQDKVCQLIYGLE